MENDPNKNESKGKRILKKALRRNSKSNNNNSNSALEQGINVSRSKSLENKHHSIEINDNVPLPTPGGTKDKSEHTADIPPKTRTEDKSRLHEIKVNQMKKDTDEIKVKKVVDIQENRNQVFEEEATVSKEDSKSKNSPKIDKKHEYLTEAECSKKSLKRKLEDESGAGTSGTSTGTSDNDADDKDPSKDKKKKNRCAVCRKKVGLTGFECRCGGLFCAVHRYSDKHECSFDYRELGAQEIRRNNPVVVSQKIHKI